jgi:DNA-binding transcriptional ArsR family regulator
MATSPTLVAAIVEAIGEPKVSVEVTLRRLREAGLIPVSGRGPYSAKMDYVSAMRMLLGVCASVTLERDAAKQAVDRFEKLGGSLNEDETLASEGWNPEAIRFPVDHLNPEHALGDALITLLRAGGADKLYVFENEAGEKDTSYRRAILRGYLRVDFYLPLPIARIEHQIGHVRKVWRYGFLGGAPLDSYVAVLRDRHLGGRMQMIEIDGTAFEIIGSAITN